MFFFFQAEDGIRDVAVTGVQTCALPISLSSEKMCLTPFFHVFSLLITHSMKPAIRSRSPLSRLPPRDGGCEDWLGRLAFHCATLTRRLDRCGQAGRKGTPRRRD